MITGTSEWSPEDPGLEVSDAEVGQFILESMSTKKEEPVNIGWIVLLIALWLTTFCLMVATAHAEPIKLIASYYSIDSLKEEGTFKYSKGVMANGRQFSDFGLTAASRDWPLGTQVKVTRIDTGASVVVMVTDRCSKRFKGKRIDLSYEAMRRLNGCEQGLIPCKVEVLP